MTVDEIKRAICTWLNGNMSGVSAIVTPTSHEAPMGKYIAVRDMGIEQYGEAVRAPSGDEDNMNGTEFVYVSDIIVTEVDGNGDTLRNVRALFQLPGFREYAKRNGFALWSIGNLMNNDMLDGSFWIRQKSFTVRVNFIESVNSSTVKAESASVNVNGKTISSDVGL